MKILMHIVLKILAVRAKMDAGAVAGAVVDKLWMVVGVAEEVAVGVEDNLIFFCYNPCNKRTR